MRFKSKWMNNTFIFGLLERRRRRRRLYLLITVASVFTVTIFVLFKLMMLGSDSQIYQRTFRFSFEKHVKICCIILTAPKYFLTRAKAVNQTWGSRCDTLYFISELQSEKDLTFGLHIPYIRDLVSGYDHISLKSRLGFIHMYKNCRLNHDWFIKADDDTYIIVEHLKKFLQNKNTSEPITFGYNYKVHVSKGYHSGGASYVLSKEALTRFYHIHEIPQSPCRDEGEEDVLIAQCLRLMKVYPGNSLDSFGREMFHPYNFSTHFSGPFTKYMHKWAMNPVVGHYNCCSDETISFHYVAPWEMYFIEFLLYKLRSPLLT